MPDDRSPRGNFGAPLPSPSMFPTSSAPLMRDSPQYSPTTAPNPVPQSVAGSSTTTPQPEPTPIIAILEAQLKRSGLLLKQTKFSPFNARSWIYQTHQGLKRLYGEKAPELSHFPIPPANVPPEKIHPIFLERVSQLQRLVTGLRSIPESSKTPLGGNNVFIGHGHSLQWMVLKDFLQDTLHLPWDEFNREPVAGLTTPERLDAMRGQAAFAFVIMTAEEERGDTKRYARDSVIHEAGLFHGTLGRQRAIIMLEDGCEEFSNIVGLTQIRFPKGDIAARFEEVRRVLKREKLI